MAINELPGLMRYKDKEGNVNLLLPITTKDNVDGIDEIEASLSETIKFTEQTLTDEQKAQARMNIGAGGTTTFYEIAEGTTSIEPGKYYVFGEVNSLDITLVETDTAVAGEYCFEFIPSNSFSGLTITPTPGWANLPQFPAGKTCQVSILRGIGVMICA